VFKQYYVRKQKLLYFSLHYLEALRNVLYKFKTYLLTYFDVVVMWYIPLPNSSQSFKVSAIFPPVKLTTFLPMENPVRMHSRKLVFYCLWS